MAISTDKFCRDCPAFRPLPASTTGLGQCRASIPVILDVTVNTDNNRNAVWPIVDDDDWCTFGRVMIDSGTWPQSGAP